MKKVIVSTTINAPMEAILKYDFMEDWELIVTGDEQTPADYKLKNGTYISWEEQREKYPQICSLGGPKNWARGRNIAFIEAYKRGADLIATVDDDNIPLDNWGKNIVIGQEIEATMFSCENGVFDPLCAIEGNNKIWFRGFPLRLISERQYTTKKMKITPLVQQNLWIGDPDIDAVCRMMYKPYWEGVSLVDNYVCSDCYSPFDTQNTIIHRSVLKDFFCVPFVGRHDDIWGSYLFECLHPFSVVYGEATVRQERMDYHVPEEDFELEMFGHRYTYELLCSLKEKGTKGMLDIIPYKAVLMRGLYRSYFD